MTYLILTESKTFNIFGDTYNIEFSVYFYPNNKDFQFYTLEEGYDLNDNDKLVNKYETLTKTLTMALTEIDLRINRLRVKERMT